MIDRSMPAHSSRTVSAHSRPLGRQHKFWPGMQMIHIAAGACGPWLLCTDSSMHSCTNAATHHGQLSIASRVISCRQMQTCSPDANESFSDDLGGAVSLEEEKGDYLKLLRARNVARTVLGEDAQILGGLQLQPSWRSASDVQACGKLNTLVRLLALWKAEAGAANKVRMDSIPCRDKVCLHLWHSACVLHISLALQRHGEVCCWWANSLLQNAVAHQR